MGAGGMRPKVVAWTCTCAALCAFTCCGVAVAGEAPGKGGPAGTGVAGKRVFWEWNRTNRRDPFEFKAAEAVETTPITGVSTLTALTGAAPPKTQQGTKTVTEAVTGQEIRRFAETRAAAAEAFLGVQQYTKAEETVQEAMNKLKGFQHADPGISERLERIRRTAVRLRTRAEIEREFKGISIDIQGIIWEPTNPMALVKGQMVKVGEIVEGALVEEIRTGEIIFNYKGVRCRKQPGR